MAGKDAALPRIRESLEIAKREDPHPNPGRITARLLYQPERLGVILSDDRHNSIVS